MGRWATKSHWFPSKSPILPAKIQAWDMGDTLFHLDLYFRDACVVNRCWLKGSAPRWEKQSEGQHCQWANKGRERQGPGGKNISGFPLQHCCCLQQKSIAVWLETATCLLGGPGSKCTAWVLLPAQPGVKVVDWRLVLLSLLSASSKMFTNFSVQKINELKFYVS